MVGTRTSRWWLATSLTSLVVCALATSHADAVPGGGFILADSVADFSGTQGSAATAVGDWSYGYYDGPFNPTDFAQMPDFSPASAPDRWVVDFDLPAPYYWTWLDAEGGHPNGTNAGGRTPTEQWAVRRYHFPGFLGADIPNATISGTIADLDGGGGNGIVARIFNDGTEVLTLDLPNGGSADYLITVYLTANTDVDFVIDPKDHYDFFDTTRFTAVVDPIPVGDYDENGIVDTADYVVWRMAKEQGLTTLPNRYPNLGGPVGNVDLMYWRSAFGTSYESYYGSGAAPGERAVPEPLTVLMATTVGLLVLFRRARFPG